jgi:hypothetical protein
MSQPVRRFQTACLDLGRSKSLGCQTDANSGLASLSTSRPRIDSAPAKLYICRGMRRAPTHRWRGGRVAEGGGLLNRYTVNPVSWVRIPSPPPPSPPVWPAASAGCVPDRWGYVTARHRRPISAPGGYRAHEPRRCRRRIADASPADGRAGRRPAGWAGARSRRRGIRQGAATACRRAATLPRHSV